MFDPSIWTEARSVPMLSEFLFFTASGCSTEQTICSRAQPSCGLQTEEWETDNDGDSEWCKWYRAVGIIQSVRGDEYIPTHASLHVFLKLMNPFFFFCSFYSSFHLYSHFLSVWLASSSPLCLSHSLLTRSETRLEQTESQRQRHSQGPDSGWVRFCVPAVKLSGDTL